MIELTADQTHVLLPYVLINAEPLQIPADVVAELEQLIKINMDVSGVFKNSETGDWDDTGFFRVAAELVDLGLLESAPTKEGDQGWRATDEGEAVAFAFISHFRQVGGLLPNGAMRFKALRRALSDN